MNFATLVSKRVDEVDASHGGRGDRVSGGCHYVVPASSEGGEEDGAMSGGGPMKDQDSDDDEDDGMVGEGIGNIVIR